MKRLMAGIFSAAIILSVIFTGCESPSIFQIGDTVPDFTMQNQYGEEVTLSELLSEEGANGAILAFYILDNSPG